MLSPSSSDVLSVLPIVATAIVSVATLTAIYRIYLHPLRAFPGPRLAAMSVFYSLYYELILDGEMTHQIQRLHEQYGPVVRIGPNEIHIKEPSAYSDIYAIGSKFTKDPYFYHAFGTDESSFGYIDPKRAKQRRDAILPMFSRRSVLQVERVIQEKVDRLVHNMLAFGRTGKPVDMTSAYRTVALDIISTYCFGISWDALADPEFHAPILAAMMNALTLLWLFKYIPWIQGLIKLIPTRAAPYLDVATRDFILNLDRLDTRIVGILKDPDSLDHAEQETIYHRLVGRGKDGRGLKETPSKDSLREEAVALIFAGTDTTSATCATGTFYVLNDPEVHRRLLEELDKAWPEKDTPMGYEALEKLPYLTAVIKESLRMGIGIMAPLPRVLPCEAKIALWDFPANTVVSMSALFMHMDSNVYPEPHTFRPERWLQENTKEADAHLVPFSRGPRSCVGVNLAWAELYLLFGHVFRKIDMTIHDTVPADFLAKSHFLPTFHKHFHAKVAKRHA